MPTNLALDDRLVIQAQRIGKHKSKKDAVNAALAEYVRNRQQLRILDSVGTIDFDPGYDYKAERRRKRNP
jgi:Arc/MetJ family transcription regulator